MVRWLLKAKKRGKYGQQKLRSSTGRRREACDFYSKITRLPVPNSNVVTSERAEEVSTNVQIESP
jgi:hypothetical protein